MYISVRRREELIMSGRVIAVVLIICVLSLTRSALSSVLLSEDVVCKNGTRDVNCSDPGMLKRNPELCCQFSSAPVCCNEIPKLVAYIVAGVVGCLALFGGLLLCIAICCCCCFFGAGATFCARKSVATRGMRGYQKV